MSEQLYFAHTAYEAQILAFVLMSNHFHLLIRTPHSNLSQVMATFMRETSRQITKADRRINQTYGQRHFRCVIGSQHHFLNAYKYVYYNPVKAGICQRAEAYPYSTLSGLLGRRHLLIPVVRDNVLTDDVEGTLNWLNQVPDENRWNEIRRAVRRPKFKLAKDLKTKKPNLLENDLL